MIIPPYFEQVVRKKDEGMNVIAKILIIMGVMMVVAGLIFFVAG